jgi:probable F420-dependent oxidoreductase
MSKYRIGIQIHPQQTTYASIAAAAIRADGMGVDSIWVWDHFYPLYGDPAGNHFEAYTLLAALAAQTRQAALGVMVTCNSYRNPNLLADMIRTVDHISNGRAILGIGAGWFERDYQEYGYEFGTAPRRLKALGKSLPVIVERLGKLTPPPVRQPLPLLIGGGGEKVTLRLVAKYASMWNIIAEPEDVKRKNAILNAHCQELGRDPAEIERTVVLLGGDPLEKLPAYVDAGMTHFILGTGEPWNFAGLEKLMAWKANQGG